VEPHKEPRRHAALQPSSPRSSPSSSAAPTISAVSPCASSSMAGSATRVFVGHDEPGGEVPAGLIDDRTACFPRRAPAGKNLILGKSASLARTSSSTIRRRGAPSRELSCLYGFTRFEPTERIQSGDVMVVDVCATHRRFSRAGRSKATAARPPEPQCRRTVLSFWKAGP